VTTFYGDILRIEFLSLDDLKVNIEREIRNIKPDGLKTIFLNFRKRLNLIIEAKGGHIEKQ
jgi:hypothetical protein